MRAPPARPCPQLITCLDPWGVESLKAGLTGSAAFCRAFYRVFQHPPRYEFRDSDAFTPRARNFAEKLDTNLVIFKVVRNTR